MGARIFGCFLGSEFEERFFFFGGGGRKALEDCIPAVKRLMARNSILEPFSGRIHEGSHKCSKGLSVSIVGKGVNISARASDRQSHLDM